MGNAFIAKEVSKIINDKSIEYPRNIALACSWIIANFKGINIKIFDVRESSSLCDYNIIASATNVTQARAIIHEMTSNLRHNEQSIMSLEGTSDAEWILLDVADVIVHLFQETPRDVFDLDTLWKDYPQITIPEEYYFSTPQTEVKKEDSTNNYF
jgi:ribosome-associated protein